MTFDPEKAQEARTLRVDALRRFKTTEGYKVLVELVRNEQIQRLNTWMNGQLTTHEDHLKTQAEMQAWTGVLSLMDDEISRYDIWLEQTLEKREKMRKDAIDAQNYNQKMQTTNLGANNGW